MQVEFYNLKFDHSIFIFVINSIEWSLKVQRINCNIAFIVNKI